MNITKDIKYIGVNDHKIDLFEGQYVVPNGMAYNSYAIIDNKIAIMDTVDAAFTHEWLDNIADTVYQMLGGIRAGLGYCGCATITDLQKNGQFIRISAAGLRESHPHDINITKEAPNYSMQSGL